MAHVAFVLDSRLRVPAAGRFTTRNLVAQPGAGVLDGAVWGVAQGIAVVRLLGRLPRGFTGAPPFVAVAPTKAELGTRPGSLDSVLLVRHDEPNQLRMAF